MTDSGYEDYRKKKKIRYYGAEAEDFYGGGVTFSPKSISGLKLWLQADSLATLGFTDNSMVTLWNDLSGNNNNFQIISGGPTYKVNIKNGKSVTRWDGTNKLQNLAMTYPSGSFSFFVVLLDTAEFAGRARIFSSRDFATNNLAILANGDVLNNKGWNDNGGFHVFATPNGWNILVINLQSGGNGEVFANGVSIGTAAYSSTQISINNYLGVDADGLSNFATMDLAEFGFYNKILSTLERQKIESYLNSRYAVY